MVAFHISTYSGFISCRLHGLQINLPISFWNHRLSKNAQYSQATLLCDWWKVWKADGSSLIVKNLQISRLIFKKVQTTYPKLY